MCLDESKIITSKTKPFISIGKKNRKHDSSINCTENGIDFECYTETEAEKWVEVISRVINNNK